MKKHRNFCGLTFDEWFKRLTDNEKHMILGRLQVSFGFEDGGKCLLFPDVDEDGAVVLRTGQLTESPLAKEFDDFMPKLRSFGVIFLDDGKAVSVSHALEE